MESRHFNLSADPGSSSFDDVPIDLLQPLLRQVLQEVMGDVSLVEDGDSSSPQLIRDLEGVMSNLTEICEVLADRALTRAQLQALAELELAIEVVQNKAATFIAQFSM